MTGTEIKRSKILLFTKIWPCHYVVICSGVAQGGLNGESNSLVKICLSSFLTITPPEVPGAPLCMTVCKLDLQTIVSEFDSY